MTFNLDEQGTPPKVDAKRKNMEHRFENHLIAFGNIRSLQFAISNSQLATTKPSYVALSSPEKHQLW